MDRGTVDQGHALVAAQRDLGPGSLNVGWEEKDREWSGLKGTLIAPFRQLFSAHIGMGEVRSLRTNLKMTQAEGSLLNSAQFGAVEPIAPIKPIK